jgi:hypothetical protein
MSPTLTKDIAYKELQKFFGETPMVLFGTGTSCALDSRYGMPGLQDQLFSEMLKICLSKPQEEQWKAVVSAIRNGKDLESAMDMIRDDQIVKHIIRITADFVSTLDKEYSHKIMTGIVEWPATGLFKKLIDGLQGTDPVLHVATPNYDLLAEYAFEKAGISYITGFVGGICRHLDWQQCERGVTFVESIPIASKLKKAPKFRKHIRLYKVHGSLNTFKIDNLVVENNAWLFDVPDGVERIIITPGTLKYKRLHQNRNDLLGKYDDAIEKHNAFLFIGFGFNDSQLNNSSLMRKLKEQKCPGLIITRDINKKIEELLRDCDNLWSVCKHQNERDESTCIFNRKYTDRLTLADKRLWDFHEFTKEIMGG